MEICNSIQNEEAYCCLCLFLSQNQTTLVVKQPQLQMVLYNSIQDEETYVESNVEAHRMLRPHLAQDIWITHAQRFDFGSTT
eukprot:15332863-Ditylum_brightwellii.AAC.1